MEIGKKLKNARVQSGMTQENVAEKINVSRQTISNWENEKSYPDLTLRLGGECDRFYRRRQSTRGCLPPALGDYHAFVIGRRGELP